MASRVTAGSLHPPLQALEPRDGLGWKGPRRSPSATSSQAVSPGILPAPCFYHPCFFFFFFFKQGRLSSMGAERE